jgi:hypothetical protein
MFTPQNHDLTANLAEIGLTYDDQYTIKYGMLNIWDKTGSFQEVLTYLYDLTKGVFNVKKLVQIVKKDLDMHLTKDFLYNQQEVIKQIFELYSVDQVTQIWENYHGYYVTCVTGLLPKDDTVLENLIFERLDQIIDAYLDGIRERIQEDLPRVKEVYNEYNLFLSQLTGIKNDLQNGLYRKVIRWLVSMHHKVITGKISIFSIIYPSHQ